MEHNGLKQQWPMRNTVAENTIIIPHTTRAHTHARAHLSQRKDAKLDVVKHFPAGIAGCETVEHHVSRRVKAEDDQKGRVLDPQQVAETGMGRLRVDGEREKEV